jgi:hypothetical protein
MTGEVKWVSERRFGIALDEDIVVRDVIEARILNPVARQPSKALPESFGIRPQQNSGALSLVELFESQWVRYAAIVIVGGAMAIYMGFFAGHHAGKMANQLATVKEVTQAESQATAKH